MSDFSKEELLAQIEQLKKEAEELADSKRKAEEELKKIRLEKQLDDISDKIIMYETADAKVNFLRDLDESDSDLCHAYLNLMNMIPTEEELTSAKEIHAEKVLRPYAARDILDMLANYYPNEFAHVHKNKFYWGVVEQLITSHTENLEKMKTPKKASPTGPKIVVVNNKGLGSPKGGETRTLSKGGRSCCYYHFNYLIFERNQCKNGKNCTFAHPDIREFLKNPPNLTNLQKLSDVKSIEFAEGLGLDASCAQTKVKNFKGQMMYFLSGPGNYSGRVIYTKYGVINFHGTVYVVDIEMSNPDTKEYTPAEGKTFDSKNCVRLDHLCIVEYFDV